MKTVLLILLFLMIAVLLLFIVLGIMSRSGEALGVVEGQLANCPDKPNCVCSEKGSGEARSVEPINLPHSSDLDALNILGNIIKALGGEIKSKNKHYIAATFSSSLFGFVDDLEIRIDTIRGIAHVRSAARVGYSDGGVNRQRVDRLKKKFQNQISTMAPRSN